MAKKQLGFHVGYRIVSVSLSKIANVDLPGEQDLNELLSTGKQRETFARAVQQELKKHGVTKKFDISQEKFTTVAKFAAMVGTLPGKSGTPDPD